MSKMGLVRKILFALQTDWYSSQSDQNGLTSTNDVGHSMLAQLVQTLGSTLKAPGGFVKEDVKAVVAYLAANLHESKLYQHWTSYMLKSPFQQTITVMGRHILSFRDSSSKYLHAKRLITYLLSLCK